MQQSQIDALYVSFDIDALDATVAGATGTPELQGMSLEDSLHILNHITDLYPVLGADLVEVSPLSDPLQQGVEIREKRFTAGLKIIECLLKAMQKSRRWNKDCILFLDYFFQG